MKTYMTAAELRREGIPQKLLDAASHGQYRNQVMLPRVNKYCTRHFITGTLCKLIEEGKIQ